MTIASIEPEGGECPEESISPWVPIGVAATRAIAEAVEAYRAALAYDPIIPEDPDHAEAGPRIAPVEQQTHI